VAAPSPVQSSPVPVQCECNRQQLHAVLTSPLCRLKRERERVGKDKGIRGSSVLSRATCCLLGVHCPVHSQSTHLIILLCHIILCQWLALGVTIVSERKRNDLNVCLEKQSHILSYNVVRVKSACVSNVNPTSTISKLFFESPSQIVHF